jgi:hypothetical protein
MFVEPRVPGSAQLGGEIAIGKRVETGSAAD